MVSLIGRFGREALVDQQVIYSAQHMTAHSLLEP